MRPLDAIRRTPLRRAAAADAVTARVARLAVDSRWQLAVLSFTLYRRQAAKDWTAMADVGLGQMRREAAALAHGGRPPAGRGHGRRGRPDRGSGGRPDRRARLSLF